MATKTQGRHAADESPLCVRITSACDFALFCRREVLRVCPAAGCAVGGEPVAMLWVK
jgi:hypothetical protein